MMTIGWANLALAFSSSSFGFTLGVCRKELPEPLPKVPYLRMLVPISDYDAETGPAPSGVSNPDSDGAGFCPAGPIRVCNKVLWPLLLPWSLVSAPAGVP